MNILISCPGRMVETVSVLKKEFAEAGFGVIATGNSMKIPALHAADKAYVVPSVDDVDYIPSLLEICRYNDVVAILSLLDKDVINISKAISEFRNLGTMPIMVDHLVANICCNKLNFYEFLVDHGFKCAKTFNSFENFVAAHNCGEIDFPVFVKPVDGEGSRRVAKCHTMNELSRFMLQNDDLIVQEFLDGPQYDIDVYIDLISRKMISIFAKENLSMLNGISNKVVPKNDPSIFSLSEQLLEQLGAVGPMNIEMFKVNGDYYINEINPRLEASYPVAYACGVDFGQLMVNNLKGIENKANIGDYGSDVLFLKYDRVIIKPPEQMNAIMVHNQGDV
ncbi:MAG: ATP-grasp domain-containing protein [Syntrophomonadaceae bacterium]|nr:ATP-grasp domain-containing protein [Syntrophomonadaceae bacterium]